MFDFIIKMFQRKDISNQSIHLVDAHEVTTNVTGLAPIDLKTYDIKWCGVEKQASSFNRALGLQCL